MNFQGRRFVYPLTNLTKMNIEVCELKLDKSWYNKAYKLLADPRVLVRFYPAIPCDNNNKIFL